MRKAKLQRPTVHSFMSPPKKLFFSFRSRNQTAKAVRSAAPRSKEPNWSWSTRSTRARTTYAPSYSTSSNSSNNSSNSSSNNNNSSSSSRFRRRWRLLRSGTRPRWRWWTRPITKRYSTLPTECHNHHQHPAPTAHRHPPRLRLRSIGRQSRIVERQPTPLSRVLTVHQSERRDTTTAVDRFVRARPSDWWLGKTGDVSVSP